MESQPWKVAFTSFSFELELRRVLKNASFQNFFPKTGTCQNDIHFRIANSALGFNLHPICRFLHECNSIEGKAAQSSVELEAAQLGQVSSLE